MNKRVGRGYRVFVFLVLVCMGSQAVAQTLYGAANGLSGGFGVSSLFTIDPSTGHDTMVGSIGFNNVTGLAFLPDGRLVGSINGDSIAATGIQTAMLIEIDPLTGAGSMIGTISDKATGCGRMPDISYDAQNDVLFGYGDNCRADYEGLWVINPDTGQGTFVGASGFTSGGNGLAVRPSTGVIYATPEDDLSLVILDRASGAGANVAASVGNVASRINALDFHPGNGTLYGSNATDLATYLVTINLADGTTTTIGESAVGLDALVFERDFAPPVPVPALGIKGLIALFLLLALLPVARRYRLKG